MFNFILLITFELIITAGDPSLRDITAGDPSLRDITAGDPSV